MLMILIFPCYLPSTGSSIYGRLVEPYIDLGFPIWSECIVLTLYHDSHNSHGLRLLTYLLYRMVVMLVLTCSHTLWRKAINVLIVVLFKELKNRNINRKTSFSLWLILQGDSISPLGVLPCGNFGV